MNVEKIKQKIHTVNDVYVYSYVYLYVVNEE